MQTVALDVLLLAIAVVIIFVAIIIVDAVTILVPAGVTWYPAHPACPVSAAALAAPSGIASISFALPCLVTVILLHRLPSFIDVIAASEQITHRITSTNIRSQRCAVLCKVTQSQTVR